MKNQIKYIEEFDVTSVETFLSSWKNEESEGGCFVAVSEKHAASVPLIQKSFQKTSVKVAGAVFPNVIHEDKFKDGILFIFFNKMPEYILYPDLDAEYSELSKSVSSLTEQIRKQLPAQKNNSGPTLLMIFDGMLPRIATIVNEIFLNLEDRVSYMGVNAGSESFTSISCLFDDSAFISNGFLGMILPGEMNPVLEHGYRVPDKMIAATSTDKNKIISIDWKPAFETYQSFILAEYGVKVDRENFYKYAVHYPFGILLSFKEIVVRIPVGVDEDGSIICSGEVPENSVLTLLIAPGEKNSETAEFIAGRINKQSNPFDFLLFFYCAGRKMHLGIEKASAEIEMISAGCKIKEKAFGAVSLGEIGSIQAGGMPLFHNATLVCAGI